MKQYNAAKPIKRGYKIWVRADETGYVCEFQIYTDEILACGTVRQGRVGLPKLQMIDKNMVRGQHEYRTSSSGLGWIKWKDNKAVSFLSNFHDTSELGTVNRRQKDDSLLAVTCPTIVSDYNKHMGLALAHGLIGGILSPRKGRKSLPKIVGPHKPQVSVEKRRFASAHMPLCNSEGKRRRCAHCSTKEKEKRTTWICTQCNVPLCVSADKNCFLAFHS
ncbi:PREDICTED: uncharacterized protein LOC108762190 [Trachymyrmex cornetzi]|uniref:uncharacterized protein LOC108762190 n=1 Tax=Trachymyrmex cornetzi TaxID=471704 RepID=UPI00084F5B33|nr:PREDICTED: uncharacterized protein LOC108762190 [Trachymyrmex cornetzi]